MFAGLSVVERLAQHPTATSGAARATKDTGTMTGSPEHWTSSLRVSDDAKITSLVSARELGAAVIEVGESAAHWALLFGDELAGSPLCWPAARGHKRSGPADEHGARGLA